MFSPTAALRNGLRFLVPLSAALTFYLYTWPLWSQCAFPLPPTNLGHAPGPDVGRTAFLETAKLHWNKLPLASSDGGGNNNNNNNNTNDITGDDARNVSAAPFPRLAPFRLLALGDPQLEGDSSVPILRGGLFPHLVAVLKHLAFWSDHVSLWQRVRWTLHDAIDVIFDDVPNVLESVRKRIDLFGNDFYLAHIYRTVRWWARPTHVAVLGDLLGSQWLSDAEFYRRADRYWHRVFAGGERVPDHVALEPAQEYDLSGYLGGPPTNETDAWARRIINIAGNHDIGYAGDITDERMARYHQAFGKPNYELRFELPVSALVTGSNDSRGRAAELASTLFDQDTNPDSVRLVPELRLVVANDMNLDTPAASTALQDETYNFINKVINTATAVEFRGHFTLVLTHVPMYKAAGICVDPPFFAFHGHDGTLKEQHQLSSPASKGFLQGIFGMSGDRYGPGQGLGRPGAVINGHDHEGCDTWHFINQTKDPSEWATELGPDLADLDMDAAEPEREWEAWRWPQAHQHGLPGKEGHPGIREITVRSMMGDFGGNAGLLSMWFDPEAWEWRLAYATCPLGTQHFWWLVHSLDFAVAVLTLVSIVASALCAAGRDVDGWVLEKEKELRRRCLERVRGLVWVKDMANGTPPYAAFNPDHRNGIGKAVGNGTAELNGKSPIDAPS